MSFLSPIFTSVSDRFLALANFHPFVLLGLIGFFLLAASTVIWVLLPRHRWLIAVLAALTFLLTDSIVRLRGIEQTTASRVGITPPPQRDDNSFSGYQFNQHEVVMPALGTDGQHWIMQTEQMLEGKTGLRVRYVDYDNAPYGRELHWSGSLHWLVTILAWGDHVITGESMGRALEHTMTWANTSILALMIIITPMAMARRFGAVPTALTAWCFVCIYPYYEFSFAGYFDHHGLVSSADLLMVLCLVGAGVGWVRNGEAKLENLTPAEKKLWNWLPARPQAKRWFIASGIAGGTGLWISTATVVPVMMGLGIGAVITNGWLARKNGKNALWVVDPTLWRVWGIAGACTSLFYYALEYLPSNMSWRLEVNHPFYALAWYGAGDILCRLSLMIKGTESSQTTFWRRQWLWLVGDLAGPAVLFIVAIAYRVSQSHWPQILEPVLDWHVTWPVMEFFFFVWPIFMFLYWAGRYYQLIGKASDPNEAYWLKQWIVQLYDLIMVLLILLTILVFWEKVFVILPTSFLIILHVDYILEFRSTLEQILNLSPIDILYVTSMLPLIGIPVILLLFQPQFPRPFKALLIVAAGPGLLDLYLASKQIRWLGPDCAVWIASLAALATVLIATEAELRWKLARKVISAGIVLLLAGVFLRLNPAVLVQVLKFVDIEWTIMPWTDAGNHVSSVTLVWLMAGCLFCLGDTLAVFASGRLGAWQLARMGYAFMTLVLLPGIIMYFSWDPLDTAHSPDLAAVCDCIIVVGGAIWLADLLGLVTIGAGQGKTPSPGLLPRSICTGWTTTYFLSSIVLPFPVFSAYMWVLLHYAPMISPLDLSQVITRDVSQRLRARLGNEQGVIVSGPTTTTWMMYYGGFKGLGTLYWENVEGLQHTIDIYSTDINKLDDQLKVLALIKKYHVTHIVIYSWDPFYDQYARLGHLLRKNDAPPDSAFMRYTFKHLAIPTWLRPIPYHMPDDPRLVGQYVFILEYVPEDQSEEDALLHIAEWMYTNGNVDGALTYLNGKAAENGGQPFIGILQAKPDYLPALIQLGLIQANQNDTKDLPTTIGRIESHLDQADKLALEDRVDLGLLLYQSNQIDSATQQLQAALAGADEKGLRHLTLERLMGFLNYAVHYNFANQYQDKFKLGMSLLAPSLRTQIIYQQGIAAIGARQYADALGFFRLCRELDPSNYFAEFTLAQTLVTVPDASLRNDAEAHSLIDELTGKVLVYDYDMLDLLGCYSAETGHFDDAVFYEQRAVQSAQNQKLADKVAAIQYHLDLFEKHQAFRLP